MRRDLKASSNWAVKGTCVHACLCGMICLSKLDAGDTRSLGPTAGTASVFGGSMTRDELIQKIDAAKREMEHAGPIHRRDLAKHIRRMEKELRFFDFSHRQAQKPHITA